VANNLLSTAEFVRVENAAAAATTDIESDGVDISGFENIVFVVAFGAITANAVTNVHLEQSTDNVTFADLEGTSVTVADDDDNLLAVLEIHRPRERYVRCVVDRGTQNAVVDGIFAIKHNGTRYAPITQGATVLGSEIHVSPAEGTI
jgi:hypothetical protein